MNKEEFAEKLSKLCTYKNGHFTSELIGLEKATNSKIKEFHFVRQDAPCYYDK